MKEKGVDKRMASTTVDIEICKKAERKYRKSKSDSLSLIYARALEDATRDVVLLAEDYEEIAKEIRKNVEQRQAKRNQNK